jgi:hypothetical protein
MPSRYSSVLDALARILTCPEERPASHVNSIRLAVDSVTQHKQRSTAYTSAYCNVLIRLTGIFCCRTV